MYQTVARAPEGRLLFRTHVEARALWACTVSCFPDAHGLVLMPNEVHFELLRPDFGDRLTDSMRAYAVWRNRFRGESGRVWGIHPHANQATESDPALGMDRNAAILPVRAGLVDDVLAWPWSLYRERVGFGFTPGFQARPRPTLAGEDSAPSPASDAESQMPASVLSEVSIRKVIHAVCGVTRSFADEIVRRGRLRTLMLRTAWVSYYCDLDVLAAAAGCSPRAVRNAVAAVPLSGSSFGDVDAELAACVLAIGDPRFSPLFAGDLRETEWRRTVYAALS